LVVRHFIHSWVFADLVMKHDVTFVFPEPGYKRMGDVIVSKLDLGGADYIHLAVHQGRQRLWKPLFQIDQIRWRPGRQWKLVRKAYTNAIGKKATALYRVASLPGIFTLVRHVLKRKLAARPYRDLEELLSRYQPDALIHPCVLEGVYINDLIEAAAKRAIPFVTIMNSWDNPSTKRAMVGIPDWLLVWGEQTKRHAIEYVKMRPERTIKFGAAQFDLFRNPASISKTDLCHEHGIDPALPILLYAGSSKESDEFSHLRTIENAIDAGNLPKMAVIYRPHPWGGGGAGGERLLAHAWRHVHVENSMRGYLEAVAAGQAKKSLPPYERTHDLLCSIDALISPLSTIIIEGALHGKPVACFLPTEERSANHFQQTASFTHFEDMYKMPEFLKANGGDELISTIRIIMARVGDEKYCARLKQVSSFFVETFEKPYSKRLCDFVENVIPPVQHSNASELPTNPMLANSRGRTVA
jgi:hypothetical protein